MLNSFLTQYAVKKELNKKFKKKLLIPLISIKFHDTPNNAMSVSSNKSKNSIEAGFIRELIIAGKTRVRC